jgi:hypothetical protein
MQLLALYHPLLFARKNPFESEKVEEIGRVGGKGKPTTTNLHFLFFIILSYLNFLSFN